MHNLIGEIDGFTDKLIDKAINGCMDGWTDGWTDELDGWIDEGIYLIDNKIWNRVIYFAGCKLSNWYQRQWWIHLDIILTGLESNSHT